MSKYKLIAFTFEENCKYIAVPKYNNVIELCLYCVNINKKHLKGIEIDIFIEQNPNNNKILSVEFDTGKLYQMDFENLEDDEFGHSYYLRKRERRVFTINDIESLNIDNRYFYLNLKDKIFVKKDNDL